MVKIKLDPFCDFFAVFEMRGCERHFIFIKGVSASGKVGNLCLNWKFWDVLSQGSVLLGTRHARDIILHLRISIFV